MKNGKKKLMWKVICKIREPHGRTSCSHAWGLYFYIYIVCPELVSLSKASLPSKLSLLSIIFCNKLMLGKEWGLHKLACLTRLEIEGGCKNMVSFLEENLLPNNLKSLGIRGLLNLKNLNYKGLQHLTDLKTLEISCCNRLWSLPEEGLPSSLSFLCIKECSLL